MISDNLATYARRLADVVGYVRKLSEPLASRIRPVETSLRAYEREIEVPGVAGDYEIGAISDGRIQGEVTGASGDLLSLRFSYKPGQMPVSDIKFTVTLVRHTDGKVAGSYLVTLSAPYCQDVLEGFRNDFYFKEIHCYHDEYHQTPSFTFSKQWSEG